MCGCDFDPPKFYESKTVKARKQHQCAECLRPIEAGERYDYASGLWEGHFESIHTCQQCAELRESMNLDCFVHHHLMDDVSECDEPTEAMEAFSLRRDENYRRLQAAVPI